MKRTFVRSICRRFQQVFDQVCTALHFSGLVYRVVLIFVYLFDNVKYVFLVGHLTPSLIKFFVRRYLRSSSYNTKKCI